MNKDVNNYFVEGCGRCKLFATPQCKVHNWPKELAVLRQLVLDCGLEETSKWGVPCYTHNQKNVVIVSAFKNYCSLSFFKGSLLQDHAGLLESCGENTQVSRQIKFTSVDEILKNESALKAYLFEAIEVEKSGVKPEIKREEMPLPDELLEKMSEIPELKEAFDALTPGRQRGYIYFFNQPKQSNTRMSRIEKSMPKIFEGKGLNDR